MIRIPKLIKNNIYKDRVIISIILLVLLPFYFLKLSSLPTSVHGDEAETALQAIQIINGNTGLIGVGWFDLPLLSFLPHGIFMLLLGENIVSDRIGSAVFGFFVLPFFYFFLKDNFNKRVALISVVLLGTSHLWLALSRVGVTYTQSTFFILAVFFILFKAVKTNRKIYFVACGLLFGLSMYSNYAVRVIPFLVLAFFINYFLKRDKFKKKLINSFIFFIFAIITFLPQGIFYLQNPERFSSRQKSIYIFSEIGRSWTNYNMSDSEILLEQTKKTFNVFAGDNSTQYGYRGKLFDYASIFFFLAGIIYSLSKIKEFKYQFTFLWILLAITGQILTTIPPPIFLPRFVIGLPMVYFFISVGIIFILDIFKKFRVNKYHIHIILVIIIFMLAFYNFSVYFLDYPKQIAGDANARAATKIAEILNRNYKNYTAYFYTAPYLYADFGTLRLLSKGTKRVNLTLDYNNILYSGIKKSIYIIYPKYNYIIPQLISKFPTGVLSEVKEIDGKVQFYTFLPNAKY